jgi:glycerol-3-phosphate dehydrogenase (NAD(P)+)
MIDAPAARVAVVGAGSWGTTFGSMIAANASVRLWALEPEVADAVNTGHENPVYLPGVALSASLEATTSLAGALDGADIVVMAVPSAHFRAVLAQAAPYISPDRPIVSLTKGIEQRTSKRMSEVAHEVLADHDRRLIGVLSGPNLATEIAAGQPAGTVVAIPDGDVARRLQQVFMTPSFRVYTNPDVVGCEIGGAVKNVIALAAGMADGLDFGDNARATLVTRGLAELTRLGVALGGVGLTFLGLAGIGDLVATCSSPSSRNHHVGEQLARGRSLDEIVAEMRMVAEGVGTAEPVLALASGVGVEMPIAEQVVEVLRGRTRPDGAVRALMERAAKAELHGIA